MNLTLVGMPGSGKSTVGLALAERLGWAFLDTDREIIRRTGASLSELIALHGDDGFRRIEEEVNVSLAVDQTVIAPGGSVIYGEKAVAHLKAIGKIVYLQTDEAELLRRLGDLRARGVSIRPNQTFHDLFAERVPLYVRCADFVQPSLGSAGETAEAIARWMQNGGF